MIDTLLKLYSLHAHQHLKMFLFIFFALSCGPVAQWITRLPTEQKIAGSIPAWIDILVLLFTKSKPDGKGCDIVTISIILLLQISSLKLKVNIQ